MTLPSEARRHNHAETVTLTSARLARLSLSSIEFVRTTVHDFRRRVALKNPSNEDLITLIDGQMADGIEREPEMVIW